LNAETKGRASRARRGSERMPAPGVPAAGDREKPMPAEQGPAWDYFTDSVPLRGDRDLREREERIGRLERGRPRRRRRVPRLGAGLVIFGAVVCAAIGLSVLGRSPARKSTAPTSTAHRAVPDIPRITAATPRIGLAPAVRVARTKPRRSRSRAKPDPRPRRGPQEPTGPAADNVPANAAVTPPEAAELEVAVEPPPEPEPVDPAPEPESEAPAAPAPQPASEPKTSSSSEANRQFGFGR
jgi:hypothetical protein